MLDNGVALDLVVRCIRATGKYSKPIDVSQKLEDVRITDQDRVDALRNRIVNSKKIGLPSLKPTPYGMDENLLLAMDTSKTVGWVVNIVSNNADPVLG